MLWAASTAGKKRKRQELEKADAWAADAAAAAADAAAFPAMQGNPPPHPSP
jgi:hypothetical protein